MPVLDFLNERELACILATHKESWSWRSSRILRRTATDRVEKRLRECMGLTIDPAASQLLRQYLAVLSSRSKNRMVQYRDYTRLLGFLERIQKFLLPEPQNLGGLFRTTTLVVFWIKTFELPTMSRLLSNG